MSNWKVIMDNGETKTISGKDLIKYMLYSIKHKDDSKSSKKPE